VCVTHNKETLCGLCDFISIPDGVALLHWNNRVEQLFSRMRVRIERAGDQIEKRRVWYAYRRSDCC
jgi:hypothetical protein